MRPWQFWIDVGGTFTDCLALTPAGEIRTHKLLSSGVYKGTVGQGSTRQLIIDPARRGDPVGFFDGYSLSVNGELTTVSAFDHATGALLLSQPLAAAPAVGDPYGLSSHEEAPVTGVRWLMQVRLADPIDGVDIRLGTTKGTNALLERRGARTAFVTTAGFRDVLRIGNQTRPKLFDLNIRRHAELYDRVVEIDERIASDGAVLRPIDEAPVRKRLAELKAHGIDSLAVCLMNGYRNDRHERVVERIARELGFTQVSCGVTRLQKLAPRANTTVVDAYLTPVIRAYLDGIRGRVRGGSLKLMTSAGGLVDAEHFIGKDSILSGPAGGVIGFSHVAQQAGFHGAIGFDMGGTSTDVSRFDGQHERRYEMEIADPETGAGVRIVAPMLAIETVAAGGGSICWFDGQKLVVGPQSAGASPGPACYGAGGPLCVTDLNVYLGKVLPEHFAFSLDREAVEQRLSELIAEVEAASGHRYAPEELAAGLTAIANANMAAAIKKTSIARGYDTRDYVLVSFGGAGAQHACAIARDLGIGKVLQHPYAGVLSAYGIGMADVKKFAARDVSQPYDVEHLNALEPLFLEMEETLKQEVAGEGVATADILPPVRMLELRYAGQDAPITVSRPADGDFLREFAERHRQLFGFTFDRPVEIYAARVEVTGSVAKPTFPDRPIDKQRRPSPNKQTRTFFDGRWQETGVFQRDALLPGDVLSGPAIVVESTSTVVVAPGWECEVTQRDDLLLTDRAGAPGRVELSSEADPITLELFNNSFAAIAEQMGVVLQKTSL
ncbi:MAG: hydantoinase, partial [Planctomycetales bacterium]|nr:hydantoinase [Planctomycetales bacterium]